MIANCLLPGDYALSRWRTLDSLAREEKFELLWIIVGKFAYDERLKHMYTIFDPVDHDEKDEDYEIVIVYMYPKTGRIVTVPYHGSEEIWKITRIFRDGEEVPHDDEVR